MHGGVFELLGVHFAQAFEAADGIGRFFQVFFLQPLENNVELALVERIELTRGFGFALGVDVHAKQRRLGHINMAVGDELAEMGVEKGEQQHLNVRAVHIGIGKNGDFAVAQAAQIDFIVLAVGVDADGHGNIVDFGVAE